LVVLEWPAEEDSGELAVCFFEHISDVRVFSLEWFEDSDS
jgi:hypothetical protein